MPEAANFALSFPEPDIALVTMDTPGKGANILSSQALVELDAHLGALEKRGGLAGLVFVSGKPGTFIAGADLREFAAALHVPKAEVVQLCRRGQALFSRLAKAPFVTVAAIDGLCLGGGAELAIWCDRRVMSSGPKTEFGFPEVKLGLYPGWGGTVRAPRIVGLGNAVELITSGQSLDAAAAAAMGLASDVAPPERLLAAAVAIIRQEQQSGRFLEDRRRHAGPVGLNETELGFLGATASAYIRRETRGQYPAPEAALELMLAAANMDAAAALLMEAEGMAELFGSPINAALLNVFFLGDRNKKDAGVDRSGVAARPIASVGVVGAGIMGSGIAAANLKRELPVALADANAAALAKGAQQALEDASYNKKLKGPDIQRAMKIAPLLHSGAGDADLAACDLVIEAVVENADVKRQLFARLEPQMSDGAILASNTSTIPISSLAAGLKRPQRFCGIHFFNPVRKMQLVEVIRGERTSDETVAAAVAYAKRIGKLPIVVRDGPGFLVNRLLFPYMNEALVLLAEGAPMKEIDRAATAFGMPMGPIALYDLVGLDTALYAGRTMWEAFPDRIEPSPMLPALVKAGRLGQKSGAGFYSYRNRKARAEADPDAAKLLEPYIRGNGKQNLSRDELTTRLVMPMLLEATRALEANIVRDPRDVDLALIYGLGFPPFRGGLLYWADARGAANIVESLAPLAGLGPRMQPTRMLREMAAQGKGFYP